MLDNFNFLACYTYSDMILGDIILATGAMFFSVIISLWTKYNYLYVFETQQKYQRPAIYLITNTIFLILGIIMVAVTVIIHDHFLRGKVSYDGVYYTTTSEGATFLIIFSLYIIMTILFSLIDIGIIRAFKCRLHKDGVEMLLTGNAISLVPMFLILFLFLLVASEVHI